MLLPLQQERFYKRSKFTGAVKCHWRAASSEEGGCKQASHMSFRGSRKHAGAANEGWIRVAHSRSSTSPDGLIKKMGGGVDGGCLWRAITEQDFSGENCQDLVTNGCWGEGRGWLASGLREALSYCTTFREAPAPRQPSQNLKDIKIVTYLNVLNASWIHKIETSFLKYSLQVLSWTQNLWLDMKSIRYFSQLSVLYTFSVKSVHLQRQCYIYSFDNHWCGNCYVEYCRCYFAKGLKDKFWKYLENKSASDNGPTFLW